MHIRIKLLLLREIEHRNEKHIEAYEKQRKQPSGKRKKKPLGNRDKGKKQLE